MGSDSCWLGQCFGSGGDFAKLTSIALHQAISGYGSWDNVELELQTPRPLGPGRFLLMSEVVAVEGNREW